MVTVNMIGSPTTLTRMSRISPQFPLIWILPVPPAASAGVAAATVPTVAAASATATIRLILRNFIDTPSFLKPSDFADSYEAGCGTSPNTHLFAAVVRFPWRSQSVNGFCARSIAPTALCNHFTSLCKQA